MFQNYCIFCKQYGLKELSPISPLDIALVHHTHVTSN